MKILILIVGSLFAYQSLYANCSPTKKERLEWKLADQFEERGQYLLSSIHYSHLFLSPCDQTKDAAKYNYAWNMLLLNEPQEAKVIYRQLKNTSLKQRLGLKLALTLNEKNFVNPQDQVKWNAWRRAEALHKNKMPKSPGFAAALSAVLPGAGQAYNGTWQAAGLSFLLNAVFLGATLELFEEDLEASGVAAGFAFSFVYIGNIVNAYEGAERMNEASFQDIRSKLEDQHFPDVIRLPIIDAKF